MVNLMDFNYKLKMFEGNGGKYHTRIYRKIAREIFYNEDIEQQPYAKALQWFFHEEDKIPLYEKKSIQEINVIEESRILMVFAEKTSKTFENVEYLARNTGWYFYLTGPKLEKDSITEFVDKLQISTSKKGLELNWALSENIEVLLIPIAADLNKNSFLLKIVDLDNQKIKLILLDVGLTREELEILKEQTKESELDLVFLSHAHKDHSQGLSLILENYPETPILCSRTTLEFYILYNLTELEIDLEKPDIRYNNVTFVRNNNTIALGENIFIQFFYAGHIPGALMSFVKIFDFSFLFTGDYSLYDYFPIAGVMTNLKNIPKNVDFLLADGTFSGREFNAPSFFFNKLKRLLELKARYRNKVLIGADNGSTALVLFFTIFKHFRDLQRRGVNDLRPNICLSTRIRRFFQIMTYNHEGIHPRLQEMIDNEYNPFQSAIIKWINTYSDLKQLLYEKGEGGIYILDSPDLRTSWIQKAFNVISKYRHNLVYLCGAIRSETARELISGKDVITLGEYKIDNKAEIWNREYEDVSLNLHADIIQLEKLVEYLNPAHVCLFHQDPVVINKARNRLRKKFDGLRTSTIYRRDTQELLIYSKDKSSSFLIKSK